ncbi:MAG: Hpt domain-containing protein [Pseudomonadota bacterium]
MQPLHRLDLAPAPVAGGPLDEDRVALMLKDFGAELFGELLKTFKGELDEALAQLGVAIEQATGSQVRPLLHLIQGCAANLGAAELSGHCEQLRASGEAVDMANIRRIADTALEALEARLASA